MIKGFLRLLVVTCCVVGVTYERALSVSFMISKSEDVLDRHTIPKKLDKDFARWNPTMHWSEKIETLLPPTGTPYDLTVDLEGFDGGALANIHVFIKALVRPKTKGRTLILRLDNGTSYKFNRVSEGVRDFFLNTEDACVIYNHKGVAPPKAAYRTLSTLAVVQMLRGSSAPPPPSGPLEPESALIEDLRKKIKECTLKEKPVSEDTSVHSHKGGEARLEAYREVEQASAAPDRPVAAQEITLAHFLVKEEDEEGKKPQQLAETRDPLGMLKAVVQFEEAFEDEQFMRAGWEKLGGGAWPPLGVVRVDQIHQVHYDELGPVEDLRAKNPVVLEIRGVLPGRGPRVVDLCHELPSLRCLIIKDSICSPFDLEGFYALDNPDDADEDTPSPLLGEDKIRFLDVQTAFGMRGDITDLRSIFERKHQATSFNYFVHLPASSRHSAVFERLSAPEKKAHQLFWIFCDYLESLRP